MVFSTCCLVLSGGASATDYQFDSVANETISSFALRSDGVSLMSVASSYTVSSNKPISYGISGGQSMDWSSGVQKIQGSHVDLSSYTFPGEPTGSVYFKIPAGTYIDVTYDVSGAFPDTEKIDFWGTFNGKLVSWSDSGDLHVKPTSCKLLVDGVVVATYTQGTSFKYSATLDVGDSVSSFTIRYLYAEHFDLGAYEVGKRVNFRSLILYPGKVETNAAMSQQGFFSSLFSWLGNIRDGISNVVSSISTGFSNLLNAVTSLPSKIADAIKGLFVPSDSQMDELKASFNNVLSEKMGFVYQAGSLVDGVFDAVFDAVDNPNSDVSFTVPAFPSFNVAGTDVSLWDDPVVVDIADNEVVQTVQQVASPFVVAVMIWGFVHSMEDAFLAFVGGKSLADWVRNRKEDAD